MKTDSVAHAEQQLRLTEDAKHIEVFHQNCRIMKIDTAHRHAVITLLEDGDAFLKRLAAESQHQPLPADAHAADDRSPSLNSQKQKRYVQLRVAEHGLLFVPWTAADGSTQFMVEMAHLPEGSIPAHIGSLTHWQIPMVVRLLRKSARSVEPTMIPLTVCDGRLDFAYPHDVRAHARVRDDNVLIRLDIIGTWEWIELRANRDALQAMLQAADEPAAVDSPHAE